jgi:hypothetical protein
MRLKFLKDTPIYALSFSDARASSLRALTIERKGVMHRSRKTALREAIIHFDARLNVM